VRVGLERRQWPAVGKRQCRGGPRKGSGGAAADDRCKHAGAFAVSCLNASTSLEDDQKGKVRVMAGEDGGRHAHLKHMSGGAEDDDVWLMSLNPNCSNNLSP